MFWKTKSRAELIEEKAESITVELFISKYNYEEIAAIVNRIRSNTIHRLEERQKELDLQQLELNNAKNLL